MQSDDTTARSSAQRAVYRVREGFNGRAWLTPAEWETYRRRPPVRFLTKHKKTLEARDGRLCSVCKKTPNPADPPLQIAHKIPFLIGVIDWGLTPDWLDSPDNLALAHKGLCNHQIEVDINDIAETLIEMGLDLNESPVVAAGYRSV